MNQNCLAILEFFFEELTTLREGKQLTYSCHAFFQLQHVSVPKYDYFFMPEIKLKFTVENVCSINVRINFQH